MKSSGRPLNDRPTGARDPGSAELQIPIDCRGRRAVEVLADLERGLAMAEVHGGGIRSWSFAAWGSSRIPSSASSRGSPGAWSITLAG